MQAITTTVDQHFRSVSAFLIPNQTCFALFLLILFRSSFHVFIIIAGNKSIGCLSVNQLVSVNSSNNHTNVGELSKIQGVFCQTEAER